MISKRLLSQVGTLKKLNTAQLTAYLMSVYKEGYIEGLREGEKEFDDAVILTEEQARTLIPSDMVDRLLEYEP